MHKLHIFLLCVKISASKGEIAMQKPKNLYELIGISKEKLDVLIKLLIPKHQEFINEKFDENYCRKTNGIWTIDDTRYFYNSVRKSLKKLAKRDVNMGRNLKKHFTKKIGITKEEFWDNFHNFNSKTQEFTINHFDEELNMLTNYDDWSKSDKKYYSEGFIGHIKLVVVNSSESRHYQSLPDKFNISYEEFFSIFNKLPKRSKEIIEKYYDQRFKPLSNIQWIFSEKRYMFNFIYPKIREIINHNISKPYQKTYGDLLEKFNISKNQMKFIISKTKPKFKEFINYAFDEDFKIRKDIVLDTNQINFLYHGIYRKINLLIKEYGIDINNEQIERQDKMNLIKESLNESFNPLKNISILKTQPASLELERIYELKSSYQAYYNYLDTLKEQQIKLTLKKD